MNTTVLAVKTAAPVWRYYRVNEDARLIDIAAAINEKCRPIAVMILSDAEVRLLTPAEIMPLDVKVLA